jgi:hypothetical protein
MKKYIFAALAMGVAVALIPSAQADSLAYKTIGSNTGAKFSIDINHAGIGAGVAESGANASSGVSGTFAAHNGAQFKTSISGSNNRSGDVGLAFDSPLNQSNSTKGIVDRSGALVDLSGNEVNLLLGAFSGSNSNGAATNGHLNFSDKGGFRLSDGITKATSELAAGAATLAATPEPGSLFLLGTGLLCMALVLFRKAPKRPSDSQTGSD